MLVFYRNIIIPFREESRIWRPVTERDLSIYIAFNREDCQRQALDDPQVLQEVQDASIDVCKNLASCSHTCGNACDSAHISSEFGFSQLTMSSPTLTATVREDLDITCPHMKSC